MVLGTGPTGSIRAEICGKDLSVAVSAGDAQQLTTTTTLS